MQPQLPPARVLLVDDVEDLRFLYRLILKREARERYEVVGEAGDGREAIEKARELQPDVVLLDVSMPLMDGMEALPLIAQVSPKSKIVMLSGFSADRLGKKALEKGAAHYLEKGVTPAELVRELDRIVHRDQDGGMAHSPRMAKAHPERAEVPPSDKRLADLQEANRELEAFSFTVSHDLRAPLRGLNYLARSLEEDATELRPEHLEILRAIRAETDRLSRLVEDLLTLSRANRGDLHLKPVDLTQMAREILGRLAKDEPHRRVLDQVEEGLAAQADPDLLQAALENLLGNAWKFTAKREEARIVVGQILREGERTFFVRDNGAGFNPARASRLFEPFQRLHDQADYAGTGVGLASVKRIITRHGGRIWAESQPGEGATFFFTLP